MNLEITVISDRVCMATCESAPTRMILVKDTLQVGIAM